MERKQESRNIALCSLMQAAQSAAMVLVNGAYIQLFMANRGIPTARIGLYNSIISFTALAATVLMSGIAEQKGNALRHTQILLFSMAAAYTPMLFLAWGDFTPDMLFPPVTLLSAAAAVLAACRGVFDFKLPYQIIDTRSYGRLAVSLNACGGLFGVVMNVLYSGLISSKRLSNPYFACMAIAFVLLLLSFLCSRKLTILNHDFDEARGPAIQPRDIWRVLSAPDFRIFLIPNLLRGVSNGIAGSVALVALAMRYSEGLVSMLPAAGALGTLAASLIYRFLEPRCQLSRLGILGLLLMAAFAFPPMDRGAVFVALYFVSSTGRLMIDTVIPVMVMRIIDPKTAGIYNAWRSILSSISATVTVYCVGIALERIQPRVLLILCVAAYGACMIWYAALYGRMQTDARFRAYVRSAGRP